ncbi:Sensor histidine kinase RcsC [Candidatus Lokiarchaeum ossiferum]|uniref:Sensor histidine kinase RcsC n=1 Tax=Candidatus Lokiarchaeum ossiferum TaxID=2951803 RepID=A0ABY6HW46_9ARCH|nr:Sensor histidine kinase RcsC [Candidatus Lokiarchaeum sp. B-35]
MFSFSSQDQIWKKIIDKCNLATVIVDISGSIVYANKAAENILGIKKESITDRVYNSPQWKTTDIDGNPFSEEDQPFTRVKKDLAPVHNIRQFIEWPNKKKILLNINAYPLLDDEGKMSHMVAEMIDITANYALIREREEYHRNYRFLFTNMNSAYAFHKMLYNSQGEPIDYIFLDINEKFTELTGLEHDLVIGRKVSEVIPNIFDSTINWVQTYGKVAKSRKPFTFEQYDEILQKTWLVNAYSPQPDHFVTLFLDISDRKKMEENLRRSESKYRSLFENSPIGVAISQMDGTIIDSNQSLLNMFGYTIEEFTNLNSLDTYANSVDRTQTIDKIQHNKSIRDFEVKFKRKNGDLFEAIINTNLVEINDQPLLMTSFQDVSKLRRIEREKKNMDRKVLTTQKLESLGILAGGIAHDFNNLLVGILGNAELALMDATENSGTRECLNDIIDSAKRAADLSQQMLLYAGKRQIQDKPIFLNEEVSSMENLLKRLVSKNATFDISLSPELSSIRGDPTQIRQVIMNLILNASDSLDGQEGVIRVSTEQKYCDEAFLAHSYLKTNLRPDKYVLFKVEDTGKGIEPDILPKIFEPFFTTKEKGRGLGLSAVLGIVQSHKGTIIVSSKKDLGTTFNVVLPIYEQKSNGDNTKTLIEEFTAQKLHYSILLVDDEPSVLKVGQKYLSRMGHKVDTANSGMDALKKVINSSQSYDLIILDLIMPHMDGFTAFQKIRENSTTLPIFISSGYTEYDIEEKFKDYSIAGFLQKPFTYEEILTMIHTWEDTKNTKK